VGFMDKVMEVGNQAASAVNQAVDKGQAELDRVNSKRKSDALLRDLGALTFVRDSGRGDATTDAEIARIVAALQAHEAAGGVIDLAVKPGSPEAQAPPAAEPTTESD